MWKKIIIGMLAGIVSGLFSTGGGMILVPAFMYWLNNGQDIVINFENNGVLVCSWKPEFFESNIIICEDKLNIDEGDLNYEE